MYEGNTTLRMHKKIVPAKRGLKLIRINVYLRVPNPD